MNSFKLSKLFISAVTLAVVFSVGFLPVAYAATPWDNVLNPTTELKLVSANGTHQIPLTTTYASYMFERCAPALYNSFTSALSNPNGRWVIIQEENLISGSPYTQIRIGWSTNPAHTTAFNQQGSTYSIVVPTEKAVVMLVENNGNKLCGENGSGSPLPLGIAPSSQVTRIFLSTYPATYPSGYEGEEIPDSAIPKIDYYPQFDYAVSDMGVAVTQFKNIPAGLNYFDAVLAKADENWHVVGDPVDADTHRLLYAGSTSALTATDYGKYVLAVKVYPPPGSPLLDEYKFKTTYIQLNIDGSTFSGNSYGDNCSNGICTAVPPYEDCSTYGTDLIGGFACVMRNFGIFLKNLFTSLFVPDSRKLTQFYEDADDFFRQKFGFLIYPFDWFSTLMSSFNAAASSCAPFNLSGVPGANLGGTFFGAHVNFNVCSAQTTFPQIYNIAVFFIRVIAVFALFLAVYRKFMKTLGSNSSVSSNTKEGY